MPAVNHEHEFYRQSSQSLLKAISLAATYHDGQHRKNEQAAPYVTHPLAVSQLLIDIGVTDYIPIIAAVLHDVVEDTPMTHEQLTEAVGSEIADVVAEVTNIESEDQVLVKKAQIEKSKTMSDYAKLVKLADKIDNTGDLSISPPKGWSAERIDGYYTWCYAVCLNLFGVNSQLDEKAKALFKPRGLVGITYEELDDRLEKYYQTLCPKKDYLITEDDLITLTPEQMAWIEESRRNVKLPEGLGLM